MRIVIIGNGPAGITAAKTICQEGSQHSIAVYAKENHPYYFRPRLPDLLGGIITQQEMYAYSAEWYEKRKIKVNTGVEVTHILPGEKVVVLSTGERVPYDRLLVATGSHSFVPPIKGSDKEGVFTLRTIDDAMNMRVYAKGRKKAVVIGGGLLGLEAARGLRGLGLDVTVIELLPRLLPRQLDEEGASLLRAEIEEQGISVVLNAASEEIEGGGAVSGLMLKDGRNIPGELILISAGIRASSGIASQAGLSVDKGIIVDERMKTSHDDIYAAGDVIEHKGKVWGIIPASIEQARIAALNMVDNGPALYQETVSYTTLKVVGIDLTSIGLVTPEGAGFQEVKMVKSKEGIYKKLVIQDGRIVGAILLGDRKDVTTVNKLIAGKVNVAKQTEKLLQEDFDLKTLLS